MRTKEEIKEYKKQYFQKNKTSILAKRKKPTKEKTRQYQQKYLYGIEKDTFDYLFLIQGGLCKICGVLMDGKTNNTTPSLDHNHKTGHIRLLLCKKCNLGISFFNEDIMLLEKAKQYLL